MYLKYASFSLISLVFLAISTSVQGQDGNKNKSNETFSKANISKIQGTHFTARVSLDPNSKSITVQIPNQKVVNKNDNDNSNNNNNNKPKNSKSKNGQNQAAQAQAKQIQMLKSMKVTTEWVEIEIPIKETTKIRTKTPLQVYDDKGNIKNTHLKNLKHLKVATLIFPDTKLKLMNLLPAQLLKSP